MNFLSFYKTNMSYDLINKFNFWDYTNEKLKIHKLVISIKLTKTTLSYIIQNLLTLEMIFLKNNFYLIVQAGNYFQIHLYLQKKTQINLFLLKYLWILYPKLKIQQSGLKKKKRLKKKIKESFFFYFDFIQKLEYLFEINLTTHITFDLIVFRSIKSKKLLFFRKSFQFFKRI